MKNFIIALSITLNAYQALSADKVGPIHNSLNFKQAQAIRAIKATDTSDRVMISAIVCSKLDIEGSGLSAQEVNAIQDACMRLE